MDHARTDTSVKPRREPRTAATLDTLPSVRVLVVEDQTDLADAVATGLRREAYAVDVANDGEDALDKLAYTEYHVVCLHLCPPQGDAIWAAGGIRSGETASTGTR